MNKLVDECNNAYQHSVDKKPIDADYSALSDENETNPKAPKFKVGDRVRITKYKNIFSNDYTENWLKKILVVDSVFKTTSWTYKIKNCC